MTPEEIQQLTKERDALRAFARRHGFQTADGAWVAGRDRVYYCACKYSPSTAKKHRLPFEPWPLKDHAENVTITALNTVWFSTPKLAEAHARREWAKP